MSIARCTASSASLRGGFSLCSVVNRVAQHRAPHWRLVLQCTRVPRRGSTARGRGAWTLSVHASAEARCGHLLFFFARLGRNRTYSRTNQRRAAPHRRPPARAVCDCGSHQRTRRNPSFPPFTPLVITMSSYTQNFIGSAYPVHSVAEVLGEKKPPTGVDLYARFALAGALCWYVLRHPLCSLLTHLPPARSPTVP